MNNSFLSLTNKQQQEAVEEIQKLMAQGISAAESIQLIANKLRKEYQHLENKK